MSDLFDSFVFDLQRFDDTVRYGDIGESISGQQNYVWGAGNSIVITGENAENAILSVTAEGTSPATIQSVLDVKPAAGNYVDGLSFSDSGSSGVTYLFNSEGGKLHFDTNLDTSFPQNIHFVDTDDALTLTEDAIEKVGENIILDREGNEVYLNGGSSGGIGFGFGPGFNASNDKKLTLTDKETGTFLVSGLSSNDAFTAFSYSGANFKGDAKIQFAGANTEYVPDVMPGSFSTATGGGDVEFNISGALNITVDTDGVVRVNADDASNGGVSTLETLSVNGTDLEIGTDGFAYDNTDEKSPVLYLTDTDFGYGEDSLESQILSFKVGDQAASVKGLSEDYSGFVLNNGSISGFIFASADSAATLVLDSNAVANGFTIFDGASAITMPTVIGGGSGVIGIAKSQGKDGNVFTMLVGDGAVVSDKDTSITVNAGDQEFVQVVFDKEGEILGIVTGSDPLSTEAAADSFSDDVSFNVKDASNVGSSSFTGLFIGGSLSEFGTDITENANKFVATAENEYTYSKNDITLTNASDTVFALDSATKLSFNGSGSGIIVDATDLDGDSSNDPSYVYNNTSGSAYFKVDNATESSALTGFVFGGVSDAITIDQNSAGLSLAFLAEGEESNLKETPGVNGASSYKITMEDEQPVFSASEFDGKGNVELNFAGGSFIFEDTKDEFFFDANGNALGFNATSGTVSMNDGAAEFLAGGSFAINGQSVDIEAVLQGDTLTYNAGDSSLFGLSSGTEINDAGNIEKIYGASGVANLTVGGVEYAYNAAGSSIGDRAFFNVSGSVATGFTFQVEDDAINVTSDMPDDFTLTDAESGQAINAPSAFEDDSKEDKLGEYTITKGASGLYEMSGFSNGNYIEMQTAEGANASVTFENLAGDSTAIVYDMNSQALAGFDNLSEGDAIKVAGVSTEVNFDDYPVEIAGESVSYVYTAGGDSKATLTDVFANVTVKAVGYASYLETAAGQSGVGLYTFAIEGTSAQQTFGVSYAKDATAEDVDGVQFSGKALGSDITSIDKLSDKEIIAGYASSFENIEQINGQSFAISGASNIALVGNDDENGLSKIAVNGSSVVVEQAAGASFVMTIDVNKITFGSNSAFDIKGESTPTVGFFVDKELNVTGISFVDAQESVTGDFSYVDGVNGASFAVLDKDELTIVGNDDKDGVSKIANVSDSAIINEVGGASQVITDENGTFIFAGAGQSFEAYELSDKSITFGMSGNEVTAITGLSMGVVISEDLDGVSVNGKKVNIDGDEGDMAIAAFSEDGIDIIGKIGGEEVTINDAAGASYIATDKEGDFKFAKSGKMFAVAGDSTVVFEIDEDEKVVAIDGANKGASITGDFSDAVEFSGYAEGGYSAATVQVLGDEDVMVVHDGFEIHMVSDGASISSATTVLDAYTDSSLLKSVEITDASGDKFVVAGDSDGVHYILDGKGEIIGVDDLDEGATLSGALGSLSTVNGKEFDVTETAKFGFGDGEFAVVGASDGIGAIVELGGLVKVNNSGGASILSSNDNIAINVGGASFAVVGISSDVTPEIVKNLEPSASPGELIPQIIPYIAKSDGVDFYIDDEEEVTAVGGLNDNELLIGKELSDVEINGEKLEVSGASMLVVKGTSGESGIEAIIAAGGSNVEVIETAGASVVVALGIDTITIGEDTFAIDSDNEVSSVGFEINGLSVVGLGLVDAQESVTGDFSNVKEVNRASFDIANDDEVMVVGTEDKEGISKIANVSDSAIINEVGGASQVITDENGTFIFAGAEQSFEAYELSDKSITFGMSGNEVTAITGLSVGVVISEDLDGVSVNGKTVDIDGDEGDMAIAAFSEDGIDIIGNIGGEEVTINDAAGASYIATDKEGEFTFAKSSKTFAVAGDSTVVFEIDADEKVVAIDGADKGASITGDFSDAVEFSGYSESAVTATVQVLGDEDVMVVHDAFEIHMVSDGASISSATTVLDAYTDSSLLKSVEVTDASGDKFVVAGDSDGVHYILDGKGEIIGVEDLDEGATLGGSLDKLTSINGESIAIVEVPDDSLQSGDGTYSVVGAEEGISEVIGLSGLVTVIENGGASVLRSDGNIALINGSQSFMASGGRTGNSDGVNFYLNGDEVTSLDGVGSNEVVISNSFEDVTSINGKDLEVINDADNMAVLGNGEGKLGDGITAIIGVGNEEGATVAAAAGASFVLSDSEGAITFGTGSAAETFTLSTAEDSIGVGFGINESVSVENIEFLDKTDKVIGDFSEGIEVNGEEIKATDDKDSAVVVVGNDSWSGVSELYVQANATVTSWGSASAVNASGTGEYIFVGADNATQSFFAADTTDSVFTFVTDKDKVTGVEDLKEGGITFDPTETTALDVNTAKVPEQKIEFSSTTSIAGFGIEDYFVNEVGGINGSISGIIAPEATVYGVAGDTDITINGKPIYVDDEDDQFNVIVHKGTADYVYDVDGDDNVATKVEAEEVSVRANESSSGDTNPTKQEFVIAGKSYVFDDSKDENNGFTFVTDDDGAVNQVASLEGALVIEDGEWEGTINGGEISIADPGDNEVPVTIQTDGNGIDSVGGLEDDDSVSGDIEDAQVHIPGTDEPGGGDPASTVTINGKPYTVVDDPDGVDVTGEDAETVSGLDDDASLLGAEGKVTVNGTPLEPEEDDVIAGRYNKKDAYIVGDRLIRYPTAIQHDNTAGYDKDTDKKVADPFNIEDISGLPTYTDAPIYGLSNPWTKVISDYAQAVAGTSEAVVDFDQPMTVYLDNADVKETQAFDMSPYSYTKRVYLENGPQAVKFNDEGGNLAVVDKGSTGVKEIELGNGGDAVVVDEAYALQNAVNIYGGSGDDSVYVRNNVNTVIDLSEGGDDMILTFGKANARVTLDGYNATTGAAIRVEEYLDSTNTKAGSIAEGIENGTIGFTEGTVVITTPEGRSEVNVGTNGAGGQIVNLMTHATSGDDSKQAVGFTGSDGGIVDGSTWTSPLIMIGNSNNTDSEGSTLLGSNSNDTFYGGENDSIRTGAGNDLVKLYDDENRGNAVIEIGEGRTTIEGANNTLSENNGDIISLAIDPTDKNFAINYNDEFGTLEIEGTDYYAVLTDVDTLEGNYTTQYIYDSVGEELYSVAIGTESSIIEVTEDQDLRPNVFFGTNTAIDFRNYTGDAIIDLKGDVAESIIDETVVIIDDDITTLYAGSGDIAFKGDDDDDTFYAGKGNTWLYGDGGKNMLYGYTGADKEGQTVFYVLGNADGAANTISGFNFVTDDNYTDTKKVTADVLEFDLDDNNITRIDISGNDLIFEITDKAGNDTESALLLGAINEDGTGKDFRVSDNVAQVAENHLVFDQFADYYYATGKNATVEVSGRIEDDVVLWLDEDDTGKFFEGDIAVIDATKSDATAQLAGNDNDNVIFAGTGETSLWGGEGGDDLLVGNSGGRDTFYYSFGNGDDTITNVKDGDLVALDVSLDQIDEIDMSDATAIRIIMNDQSVLTINDAGHNVGVMIDNGEGEIDTYYTAEARQRQ